MPNRIIKHDYGWFIWMPFDVDEVIKQIKEETELSPALGNILRYAEKHACWFINLDTDAEKINNLEYYEDE